MEVIRSSSIPELVAHKSVVVEGTGVITQYDAVAPIGTLESEAKWLAWRKVITESGTTTTTVTTWADGDGSYDNVATDLTTLAYS